MVGRKTFFVRVCFPSPDKFARFGSFFAALDLATSPNMSRQTAVFIALTLIAVVSRLLPHEPNVTFVACLGLLAGKHCRGLAAVLIPLAAMAISDAIGHFAGIGNTGYYHPAVMFGVYLGMAASGLIGRSLRGVAYAASLPWVAAPVACSLTFFLSSNLAVWIASPEYIYPGTLSGLVACFVAALPFLAATVYGDLYYTGLVVLSVALHRAWSGWRVRRRQARVRLSGRLAHLVPHIEPRTAACLVRRRLAQLPL